MGDRFLEMGSTFEAKLQQIQNRHEELELRLNSTKKDLNLT